MFEPDKISLIRTLALTMAVVWLVKVANGGFAWLPAAPSGLATAPTSGAAGTADTITAGATGSEDFAGAELAQGLCATRFLSRWRC